MLIFLPYTVKGVPVYVWIDENDPVHYKNNGLMEFFQSSEAQLIM